jgi:hypothetical protein
MRPTSRAAARRDLRAEWFTSFGVAFENEI